MWWAADAPPPPLHPPSTPAPPLIRYCCTWSGAQEKGLTLHIHVGLLFTSCSSFSQHLFGRHGNQEHIMLAVSAKYGLWLGYFNTALYLRVLRGRLCYS